MSIRSYYPSIRPINIINFSRKTLLNSGVRFTRGGGGTYVDENGLIVSAIADQPRFNHNPETLEYEGLLVEEARTNLLTYSEDMGGTGWNVSGQNAPLLDVITAPDGTTTADLLTENTSNGAHQFYKTITIVAGNVTYSAFFKAKERSKVVLARGFVGRIFDLLAGTSSTFSSDPVSWGMKKLPGGWYRCSITINEATTTGQWLMYIHNGTTHSYTGDGTSGVYIWGAQAEQGSYPTSYIPTSGSTVTRPADLISVSSVSGVKSGRIKLSSVASNSYSPYFSLKDSTSPAKPYVLELGSVNSAPVASVVYNLVRQGTTSFQTLPNNISNESTLSFNFEPTTGAVEISSTASDDADSHVLSLPATLSRPLPSDQTLNLLSVEGKSVPLSLKEIYLWETALTIDQLASVSSELRSIGQPVEASTGLNENSDYVDAEARPTLDLRFAERKDLFDDTTEQNLVTFSRGSIGTYTDEEGIIQTAVADEPRFDHDPTTGESLGLLVEESRSNKALYSENLYYAITYGPNGTNWYKTESVSIIPNSIVDVSGGIKAIKLSLTNATATDSKGIYYRIPAADVVQHTFSVYAKAGDINTFDIQGVGQSPYVTFTLSGSGSYVISTSNTSWAASITQINNGWYRCTYTVPAGGGIWNAVIRFTSAAVNNNYFYVCFPSLERIAAFPTSYIPTPATFTSRVSIATYYDATGTIQTASNDVARSNAYLPDENGVMRPAGLLLEAQGTNLITRSLFTGTSLWTLQNISILSTNHPAPDNTNTAVKIGNATSTATNSIIWYQYNGVGTIHTFTFYAKGTTTGQSAWIQYYDNGANQGGSTISLDNGVVTNISLIGDAFVRSQYIGNGWYRCQITCTPAGGTNWGWRVGNYLTGDIYIWGAQLEASPYPTSYIPTSGSIVTRAADVSSSSTVTRNADVVQITGSNFSSWYNQSEGTTFVQTRTINSFEYSTAPIIAYDANNDIWDNVKEYGLRYNSSGIGFEAVVRDSSAGFIQLQRAGDIRASSKAVIALTASQFTFTRDGLTPVTAATTGPMSSITRFTLNTTSGPRQSTRFSRLTYWPVRLPDTTLQVLTDPAISTWDLIFDSSLSTDGTCAVITASTCTYTIDWGDGTPVQTVNATGTGFTSTHRYTFPQTYKAKIEVLSGTFRPYYNNSAYADQLVEIRQTPDGWTNTATNGFGTTLNSAWYGADNLKVVDRELNASSITDFSQSWRDCSSLTSFPLLDTSSGTNFGITWYNCSSLTSFPLLDTSSGTNFSFAWRDCSSLTSFPTNFFDAWTATPANNCFVNAWDNCSSLTATSVENILNSIDTSGRSAPASGVDITIDYNASSGTPNVSTAVTNLKSRGWTITLNGVLQ